MAVHTQTDEQRAHFMTGASLNRLHTASNSTTLAHLTDFAGVMKLTLCVSPSRGTPDG